MVQRAENCSGPAVVARLSGGRCPCCAGRVGASFCGYGRPEIMQRQVFSSTVEAFIARVHDILLCNREGHSTSAVLVMTAMQGFWRILRHFSRSSGYLGVERQFFEYSSAHTCECSRAPVVPESPGVLLAGDSAQGLCQFILGCCGYTHSLICH